jgi:hypothetical protein
MEGRIARIILMSDGVIDVDIIDGGERVFKYLEALYK